MTNPVHLLTVAALLLVAFLVGAIIGTLARLIALRLARKPATPSASPVEEAAAAPPLVAAPLIAPLPVAATPVPPPPAEVPVPDFAATLIALANEAPPPAFVEANKPRVETAAGSGDRPVPAGAPLAGGKVVAAGEAMQPAHVAGETTSGVHVAAPVQNAEPPPDSGAPKTAEPRSADVILFPAVPPAAAVPTDIVVGGESVAVVDANDLAVDESAAVPAVPEPAGGLEPNAQQAGPEVEVPPPTVHGDHFHFVAPDTTVATGPTPATPPKMKSETIPVPAIMPNAAVGTVVATELSTPEVVEAPLKKNAAVEPTPEKPIAQPESPRALSVPPSEPVGATDDPKPAPAGQPAAVPKEASTDRPDDGVAEKPQAAQTAAAIGSPTATGPEAPAETQEATIDEDAAMRAIEGNWSPRRRSPRRQVRTAMKPEAATKTEAATKPEAAARPDTTAKPETAPKPETNPKPETDANQAVAASARAVTAARRTAQAVVAEVAGVEAEVKAEAGRPAGLDGPREGRKDDLTHIIGVLPVIETALNKLGIFHFDQVGALTDENIGWIEGHLGVPGRIGRELWREQARELSAVLRPRRVAEK